MKSYRKWQTPAELLGLCVCDLLSKTIRRLRDAKCADTLVEILQKTANNTSR